MDGISLTSLMILLAIGVGTYMLFAIYSGLQIDPREPPAAQSKIPYFGHVIGIMRSKFNYYVNLSHKTLHPILTIILPGTKMYVVNSLDLVQAIQKQPKTLAFPPIEAKFANTICGVSPEAHKILLTNANGDEGDWGLSMESYAAMRAALAPGAGLDKMNRVMIQNIAGSLDGLIPAGSGSVNINLSHWLRDIITLATTNSVYGPQNPFKDREVQDSFWQFESQMMSILVGILPSIFASKGLAARARVSKAFEDYLKTGGYKEGSLLMKNRYETSVKNGVPIEDIARYEVGGAIAILVNTAPAAFWLVLFLYSDPELLEEIRKEIWAVVKTSDEESGEANEVYRLDITNLKTNCPLLLSSYQESLRHRSMGTSVREVVKDTVLDGKWLLKKDCMIQMPSRIIHMDPHIWGSDVEEFNPRRFMKDQKRVRSTAFRAFGGGTTLCPGRHFATNEVLAVVSMFVMRFDIAPVVGKWSLPTTDKTNVAAVLMEPDDDIEVRVEARKGFDGRWAFGLRDSEEIFAIVDEDLTDHDRQD